MPLWNFLFRVIILHNFLFVYVPSLIVFLVQNDLLYCNILYRPVTWFILI